MHYDRPKQTTKVAFTQSMQRYHQQNNWYNIYKHCHWTIQFQVHTHTHKVGGGCNPRILQGNSRIQSEKKTFLAHSIYHLPVNLHRLSMTFLQEF